MICWECKSATIHAVIVSGMWKKGKEPESKYSQRPDTFKFYNLWECDWACPTKHQQMVSYWHHPQVCVVLKFWLQPPGLRVNVPTGFVLSWLDSMQNDICIMIENLAASLASSALWYNCVARWVMFEVLCKCGFWFTEWEVSYNTEWVWKHLTFAKWASSWTLSTQDCFFSHLSVQELVYE